MPADPVWEALLAFATILGALALLGVAATACKPQRGLGHSLMAAARCETRAYTCLAFRPAGWLLLFNFALKKLPPVQEALGLKWVCRATGV